MRPAAVGAADDFAAPVDEVGKTAVFDDTVQTERAVPSERSRATSAVEAVDTAADVVDVSQGVADLAGGDGEKEATCASCHRGSW